MRCAANSKNRPAEMRSGTSIRLGVISLGCPKNLVDTERALGQMLGGRIALVEDLGDADWVLVNTCGFIKDARDEARTTIRNVKRLRKDNPALKIAVAGCLSQRYGPELAREMRGIDYVTGILTRENAAQLVKVLTGSAQAARYGEDDDRQRLRITPRHIAYVRISEGCDNRCAYCVIPDIRGPLCSRPVETVLADAEELLSDGAVELNVIAQDTTAYGVDLYGKAKLAQLLAKLSQLNGKGWVRLLYAHPAHLGDDVIEVIAAGPPVVPYVDLPLQHVNDRILAAMGRRVTRNRIEALIGRIRSRIPGVYVRTAFIVGFPGETGAEFEELLDFIVSTRFERLGAFTYSRENGTPAAALAGQVPEKEKRRRLDAIMKAQSKIAFEFNGSLVGGEVAGIIDGPSGRDDLPLAGRTYGDAPEVDGTVFLPGGAEEGKIVTMRITGAEEYDLVAQVAR